MKIVFPWMRPKRVRRTVVAGAGLFYLGFLVCGVGALTARFAGSVLYATICGAAGLSLSSLLLASGIPGPNDRSLDERQRMVVLEAVSRSYRIVTALLTAGIAGVFFVDLAKLELSPSGNWKILLLAYLLLVPLLPTALIAWTEPDYTSTEAQPPEAQG